jgi:hypothetical protein
MKALELKEATAPLADYARDAKEEPVVLLVNGQPVAALLALENVDLETVKLSNDPQFIALIEHSRQRQQQEGGLSSDEVRRRLGLTK